MVVILPPLLAVLAFLTGPALAHGGLANYTVGNTWYRGWDPNEPYDEEIGKPWVVQRRWDSIDPIFSVDDKGLACNNPGTPPVRSIPINAGDVLTAVYWYWLHPSGPMSAWLAYCGEHDGDCDKVDVNQADWFKIWEGGFLGGPNLAEGIWWQRQFQNWDGTPDLWPVTIPAILKPGAYMVRHEILSIHIANKPQFYPECAHLNVSGTGTELPPKEFLKKFPGAYAADDPAIRIDIYNTNSTNYTIPGGPIWDRISIVDKYCRGC